MCLVNFRSKEDPELVIAPRPVSAPQPLSIRSPRESQTAGLPIPLQPHAYTQPTYTNSYTNPRGSATSHHSYPRTPVHSYTQPYIASPHPQGQLVVIEQRTPRTSGALSLKDGQGYTYGEGPVVSRQTSVGRPAPVIMGQQGGRRSGSLGVERRRTSSTWGKERRGSDAYGKDPRASNGSWRSTTRERVVVVDSKGARREYYR